MCELSMRIKGARIVEENNKMYEMCQREKRIVKRIEAVRSMTERKLSKRTNCYTWKRGIQGDVIAIVVILLLVS